MRSAMGAWSLLGVVLLLTAGPAGAFSAGLLTPTSGAPGEANCLACHNFAGFFNPGILAIAGPESYQPGQTYEIIVTLTGASTPNPPFLPVRWGLQMTAIDTQSEAGAGSFVPGDDAVLQAFVQGFGAFVGRPYITHKRCGLDNQTPAQPACPTVPSGNVDVPGWVFDWIAPAQDVGTVDFYVTANAANGDGTRFDDAAFLPVTAQVPEPAAGLGVFTALSVLAALRRRA